MAAFEQFLKEQLAVDELLFKGYSIASIEENLDGAKVSFVRGEPAKGNVELLLLTADARKYVTSLVLASQKTRV